MTRAHYDAVMTALSQDVERLRGAVAEKDATLKATAERAAGLEQGVSARDAQLAAERHALAALADKPALDAPVRAQRPPKLLVRDPEKGANLAE